MKISSKYLLQNYINHLIFFLRMSFITLIYKKQQQVREWPRRPGGGLPPFPSIYLHIIIYFILILYKQYILWCIYSIFSIKNAIGRARRRGIRDAPPCIYFISYLFVLFSIHLIIFDTFYQKQVSYKNITNLVCSE